MDTDQMQALRDLIEFARDHVSKIYKLDGGDGSRRWNEVLEAASIAEAYLDGDQNEPCPACNDENPEGCTYC